LVSSNDTISQVGPSDGVRDLGSKVTAAQVASIRTTDGIREVGRDPDPSVVHLNKVDKHLGLAKEEGKILTRWNEVLALDWEETELGVDVIAGRLDSDRDVGVLDGVDTEEDDRETVEDDGIVSALDLKVDVFVSGAQGVSDGHRVREDAESDVVEGSRVLVEDSVVLIDIEKGLSREDVVSATAGSETSVGRRHEESVSVEHGATSFVVGDEGREELKLDVVGGGELDDSVASSSNRPVVEGSAIRERVVAALKGDFSLETFSVDVVLDTKSLGEDAAIRVLVEGIVTARRTSVGGDGTNTAGLFASPRAGGVSDETTVEGCAEVRRSSTDFGIGKDYIARIIIVTGNAAWKLVSLAVEAHAKLDQINCVSESREIGNREPELELRDLSVICGEVQVSVAHELVVQIQSIVIVGVNRDFFDGTRSILEDEGRCEEGISAIRRVFDKKAVDELGLCLGDVAVALEVSRLETGNLDRIRACHAHKASGRVGRDSGHVDGVEVGPIVSSDDSSLDEVHLGVGWEVRVGKRDDLKEVSKAGDCGV